MKRRVDEVQFGARGGPQSHHRILATQNNPASTIYQLTPGVLKAGTADGGTPGGGALGNQSPNVQYSTTYNTSTMAIANVTKSPVVQQSATVATGSLHVVNSGINTVNSMRPKSGTTVASQPTSIVTGVSGGTTPGQASALSAGGLAGSGSIGAPQATAAGPGGQQQTQFQRLKVEDALSYLDHVKSKFGNQPQVYNDFLDIMKEFKSQSIDTPGVIDRVSTLFKGHPELIVGFNTFLPPGYKIEMQANDKGYSYQVSVSMPSPSCGTSSACPPQQQSPPQKLQIMQGSGTMVHTIPGAVNLITHAPCPQPLHGGVSGGQAATSTNPMQQQQQASAQLASAVLASPQNFVARDRERTLSGGGGGGMRPASSAGASLEEITTGQNLHHISQAHQQIVQQASGEGQAQSQNQPVEFNHAISYVNKIKNRFQNQPEKYKRFLEILHQYQKEQKVRDGQGKQLTEAEVYTQVAKLFDKQDDLLREFGQFLPDATSHSASLHGLNKGGVNMAHNDHKKMSGPSTGGPSIRSSFNNSSNNFGRGLDRAAASIAAAAAAGANDFPHALEKEFNARGDKERNHVAGGQKYAGVKRSPSYGQMPHMGHMSRSGANVDRSADGPSHPKRHKPICRDVTLAEASKFGSLNDYAFFDKVRKALRSPEVYENFLRCLILFNQEIVSKSELLTLTAPFLGKFPDLQRWFQDFLGSSTAPEGVSLATAQRQDRSQGELAQEIDLSTCKRLGASYCALPKPPEVKKCSGRTALCREVLNDTWVSFPTWAEDSTFVTSRKTQYEEMIYRCEDERFELDVVIETNSATIRVLEGVQKKLSRMSPDEVARFRLDDCLGGNSPTIHQRALRRIYGEKASDIIQGLKKNPVVAVPVVLRRLKAKEEEWREAQKGFNKQWREQNEKYYLKSLDHQGINFKQTDIKALRSKSLFNEIETLYDERHEQNEESTTEPVTGPHLVLPYKDKTILDDAANLLIHHVKRQTGIQKQEKTKIKHILRQFVPDLFFSQRQQLSDDEREDDVKDMDVEPSDADAKPSSSRSSSSGKVQSSSVESAESPIASTASTSVPAIGQVSIVETVTVKSEPSPTSETRTQVTSATPVTVPVSGETVCNVGGKSGASVSGADTTKGSDIKSPTTICDEIKVEVKQDRDSPSPPLPPHAVAKHTEEAYTLFFGNSNWYLFLRLHAILCERLRTMYERAQALAVEEAKHRSNRRESTATALRLKPKSEIQVEDFYPTFLDMLKNVLDGNMEANNYEDSLREMFGIHAYVAFTLDRVVSNAVRQLQHCVTERGALECVDLFQQEQRKNGAGGLCKSANKRIAAEMAYQKRAEASLQDENCFKVYIYKIDCRVTIELLDTESDDTEKCVANTQAWSNYVERLANPAASATGGPTPSGSGSGPPASGGASGSGVEIKTEKLDDEMNALPRKPLYLKRNVTQVQRVLRMQKKNSQHSVATASAATLGALVVSNTATTQATASATVMTTTTANADATSLTTTSTESASASLTTTTSSSSRDGSTEPVPMDIDESVTTGGGAGGFWAKRPPERMPAPPTLTDEFFADSKAEMKLNFNSYKMVFMMNKDDVFYKRNALRRAKTTHELVTKRMKTRFQKFINAWLEENVAENQKSQCSDWLMGLSDDLAPNSTVLKQDNDVKKAPYSTINRYTVTSRAAES
uniref:Paired amphipathic helix protein Sin3a n=1 Tax=Phlebotomus kandelakii TaxID=1109342 RepID=A0A6B2EGL1_9DIPT